MRRLGLERLRINLEPSAVVARQPTGLQVQRVGRAHTPGGIQHHLRPHAPAALQNGDGPAVLDLDALDLRTKPQRHAAIPQLMGEVFDQLMIDKVEHRGARFHQRHRDIQRTEDGGVFHTDDTGADHRQAPWQAWDLDDLIAVEYRGPVERHARRAMRPGADGDQETLGLEAADVAVIRGDLDAMRIEEPRRALERLDPVAGELMLQHIDLVVECHVQPHHQVLGANILFHPVRTPIKTALAPSGQVEHGFAQRLRWDRACVHRNPADATTLFHHKDRAAVLRRLDGGTPPGGSGTDDDEVVAAHGRESDGRSPALSTVIVRRSGFMDEQAPGAHNRIVMDRRSRSVSPELRHLATHNRIRWLRPSGQLALCQPTKAPPAQSARRGTASPGRSGSRVSCCQLCCSAVWPGSITGSSWNAPASTSSPPSTPSPSTPEPWWRLPTW